MAIFYFNRLFKFLLVETWIIMYFSTYFLKIELKKSDQTYIFSLDAYSAPMLCFQKKMADKEVQLTAFASAPVLRFLGFIFFQNLLLFVLFLKLFWYFQHISRPKNLKCFDLLLQFFKNLCLLSTKDCG